MRPNQKRVGHSKGNYTTAHMKDCSGNEQNRHDLLSTAQLKGKAEERRRG